MVLWPIRARILFELFYKNLSFKSALAIPTVSESTFIQLIYSCFLVAIFPPIAWLHFLHVNTLTTHNSSICSDEGLTLEMSAL